MNGYPEPGTSAPDATIPHEVSARATIKTSKAAGYEAVNNL